MTQAQIKLRKTLIIKIHIHPAYRELFNKDCEFICETFDKSAVRIGAESYKLVKKVFKKVEFSEFAKLNVGYDLAMMQEVHNASLKKENFNYENQTTIVAIKETIKSQNELN